jgi:3'-5' exoribonuclease
MSDTFNHEQEAFERYVNCEDRCVFSYTGTKEPVVNPIKRKLIAKRTNVEDILKSQTNTPIEGTYVIFDLSLRPFNDKPGHFLIFNLKDKTGTISCKIWDNAEYINDQLQQQKALVVLVKGRTNVFNGKMQLIVDKIKVEEKYNIEDLVVVSTEDPEKMWNELCNIMDLIKSDSIKKIWESFKNDIDFVTKFKFWTGTKSNHHAYRSGLLEHTLSVLKIVTQYYELMKGRLSLDKMLIGAFFHDIGKLEAYDYNNIKIERTTVGKLHEHTVIGYYKVRKFLEENNFSQELIEDIGHIILSHHGKVETGAVITPMTLEAKIVSYADYIDFECNHIIKQTPNEKGWFFDQLLKQELFFREQL